LNKLGIPACWLDFTCKTGKTIVADDSENSSNEVKDSNPRKEGSFYVDEVDEAHML